MTPGQSDTDRLADAFRLLTGPERQLLVCALAGNFPERLNELRPSVLRGLAKAGLRMPAQLMCACGHDEAAHAEESDEEIEAGECARCACMQFEGPEPYSLLAEENQ